jgi:uncharacterized protein YndB with AHSA1/START domain
MTSTGNKTAPANKKTTPAGKNTGIPPIEKELVIAAPVEKVWAALTNPVAIGNWMEDDEVKVDLKVGGKYTIFGGETTGSFTVIEKPGVLEYTWRQREWKKSYPDTLVRWELEPEGKKTRLKLVHSQFPDQETRDDHDEGWDIYFLEPMKEWLEL